MSTSGRSTAIVILDPALAQPATSSVPDPTLLLRAREFDREALAEICDRNVGRMYTLCATLLGDTEAAELLVGRALLRSLDGLESFTGDGAGFDLWLLRLAAAEAARHRPQMAGIRADLTRLSHHEYELLALRVVGDVDTDHLSPALGVRAVALRSQLAAALRRVDGAVGASPGADLRLFDEAIDRVSRGADPQRTAASLSAPPDALALLRTVAEIRSLFRESVPEAAAIRMRTAFLAAAAERRTQWVRRHQRPATVPGIDTRRYPNRVGAAVALGIAGGLALLVGVLLTGLSVFADPDSPFYPIKRVAETALVAVDGDPLSRAQLEIRLAQVREREAEDMASRGDGNRSVDAMSDRFDLLRDASRDLIAAQSRNSQWKTSRDRLFEEASHPTTVVQRDLRVTGQGAAADQVAQLSRNYETDRKQLDPQLGHPVPSPEAPKSSG
jgi:DNA-directed RNA polymerase specialized sigma24 family protein